MRTWRIELLDRLSTLARRHPPLSRDALFGQLGSFVPKTPEEQRRYEEILALCERARPSLPTFASITPNLGDPAGGIPVRILGTSFTTVTSVTINGVPCTGVTIVSDTEIHALTPALPIGGPYDVVVMNHAGAVAAVAAFESWYPTQIAGARVYDPELGVTGSPVSAWSDQNGGAENLAQAVAVNRPGYAQKRFGGNTRHGLVCDGVTEASYLALAARLPLTAGKSVWWASKHTSNKSAYFGGYGVPLAVVDDTNAATYQSGPGFSGGKLAISNYSNIAGAWQHRETADLGLNDGSPRVYGMTYDSVTGDIVFYADGVVVSAGLNSDVDIVHAKWDAIGAGNGPLGTAFQGELAPVVVKEGVFSAAEIAKLDKWVFGKFVATSYVFRRTATVTPWFARDGAGLLALSDTSLFLLGGWNPGQFPGATDVTNEVWNSIDRGATWVQLLPDDPAATNRWSPRHTAGWIVHKGKLFVIGSDIYNGGGSGTSDVWSSTDGVNWTLVTNTAPWGPRILHMVASYKGDLYVMGGQRDLTKATALHDVWVSHDDGATWTQLTDAPWAPRGMVYTPCVLNGYLWLCGGGTYDAARDFYNDVWRFDGTTWTQILADGVAPWSRRQYLTTLAFEGKLWVINGYETPGLNNASAWSSVDGINWVEQTIVPWLASHADAMTVLSDRIVNAGGNGEIDQPGGIPPGDGKVYAISNRGYTL